MKYLIFPLGNHGDKYEKTRHNAGRIVVSKIKNELSKQDDFLNGDTQIYIPECYMNESGIYLKKYIKNKNINPENIIIIYDDKDLEIGDVRVATNRGDGGHNGLKNIIENLGTKNFWRIRIGIAPVGTGKGDIIPPHGSIVQKYVLDKFTGLENDILSDKNYLSRVVSLIEKIIYNK